VSAQSLYPLLIEPRYVERIWGGHDLDAKLGKHAPADKEIGESWEIYEENSVANGLLQGKTIGLLREELGRDLMGHVAPEGLFPLLTKLIDAREALSVQVHPDDHFAQTLEHQPYGKTECWYVVSAAPGATLTYGFKQDATPREYEQLVADGKLDSILRPLEVHEGDVIYIPAGMVHAIGAGIIVYELQQTSDTTYRIYDWNRRDAAGKPRELHVDKAKQVLDYHAITAGAVTPLQEPDGVRTVIIAGEYFCQELIETGTTTEAISTYQSPVALCALDQPVMIMAGDDEPVTVAPYSSALIPAGVATYTLQPGPKATSPARALVAYIPTSAEATRRDLLERGFDEEAVDAFLAQFAPAADLGQGVQVS